MSSPELFRYQANLDEQLVSSRPISIPVDVPTPLGYYQQAFSRNFSRPRLLKTHPPVNDIGLLTTPDERHRTPSAQTLETSRTFEKRLAAAKAILAPQAGRQARRQANRDHESFLSRPLRMEGVQGVGANAVSGGASSPTTSIRPGTGGSYKRKRSGIEFESSPGSGGEDNEDEAERRRQPGVKRACNECRQQKVSH